MGVKIPKVGVPVCNSFKAKIFKDQLCYTVDPNKYRKDFNNGKPAKEEDLSLSLFLNYNEDREVSFTKEDDMQNGGKHLYVGTLGSVFQSQ